MTTQFISIKEAAKLADKSQQTIRRLIKSKKIKYKRAKTPQGFNYEVDKESVLEYYGLEIEIAAETQPVAPVATKPSVNETLESEAETVNQLINKRDHRVLVDYAPVKEFNDTLQILMKQHAKEKENLFKLVEAFQNKVVSLETKIKTHQDSDRKWYRFW